MPPKTEKLISEEQMQQLREMMESLVTTRLDSFRDQIAMANSAASKPTSSIHPSYQPLQPKPPKITLRSFDGSEPLDWIFQAEQHFDLSQTPHHQRLTYIPFFMTGSALAWFKWIYANHPPATWDEFIKALELRFGPSSYENHQIALFNLRQTGSVVAYQSQFEHISNRTRGIPPLVLLNCFLSGLRVEIQRELQILKPYSLHDAIGMAKLIEAKLADSRYSSHRSTRSVPPATTGTTPEHSSIPIKRLTAEAMQERRSRGLCFNCDDPWVTGHRCKSRQFMILLVDDDYTTPVETEENPPELEDIKASDVVEPASMISSEHFHLSRAALLGSPSTRTLRVTGRIQQMEVSILIDSGSSHNILQPRVASFLQLNVESINPFDVFVGNGETIKCSGSCNNIPVHINDAIFQVPFMILPIHGADVVLGVQWLSTLGPFLSDYSIPCIQFFHNNKPVTISGANSPISTHASFSQFTRYLHTDTIASIHSIDVTPIQPSDHTDAIPQGSRDPSIQNILNKFPTIFSQPKSLPPHRSQDHHIHLLPGSSPVNVKPYRYPHCHKETMTKMIKEMLENGTIRPSTSPFSSPVLLVRKKDGSWRFCVDYRALNAITIKDRFPIPTVDELLDELHGATHFSKLDLRSGYHQILLASEDTFKTAFRTVDGHFEFLVMPFGLSNAPSTFQATMNEVFRECLRRFILVFFDDILVYSPSLEAHLIHLQTTLEILQQHQFFAKESKCSFGVSKVEYLGHIVSAEGVAVDPSKITAILEWPCPNSVTALRGFLGLTGYYRKFVRHYATIAAPLTELLKTNNFSWSDVAQKSFQKLKDAMVNLPVLRLPDRKSVV